MAASRPTVRRRRLAALLVDLRERAGKTPEMAAERIGCHRTKINRIENARLGVSLGELRDLLTFYGVEDAAQVEEAVALAQRSREPGWVQRAGLARPSYADFIDYERTADYIRSFQNSLIAGLLQTPDYAKAVLSTSPSTLEQDEVEALVTARIKRQEVLQRPEPPRMCVIEGESALRLQVGGAQVMRKQLEHLMTMAERPSVEVQVIPDSAGAHAGLAGSFVLFGFPNPSFSEVVCVEHRTGTLYMETPEETGEYTLIFDSLRSIALSPRDSLDLIAKVRQEL
ncbi:helix-turn-helix transcriptional regulator [Streptomyces poriferorum]|uniref:helix-turn-helix domain-containing protein n=1 Tax=Streptomyces TaxID=1883 RepID=UPI001C5D00CD|nr:MULTISPECIES: helix-turn-helix transcriptional regulator [Streptomyces]MBW5249669.1 helix-turn-helix domain-containing protein [Streptomyces poriferorum]MBW5256485.1 helix-turn-helix domain-containing protein [Streptomyces poriferorum]WLQ48374.1 helix-turn-helix transcriptional regulator [Streptomyces sp. Alt1]